jgi:hypothetical protein
MSPTKEFLMKLSMMLCWPAQGARVVLILILAAVLVLAALGFDGGAIAGVLVALAAVLAQVRPQLPPGPTRPIG